jgi:hypothetical protein
MPKAAKCKASKRPDILFKSPHCFLSYDKEFASAMMGGLHRLSATVTHDAWLAAPLSASARLNHLRGLQLRPVKATCCDKCTSPAVVGSSLPSSL